MKIHALTAVSRPWNLDVVGESIARAQARAPEADLTWHLRFDVKKKHVGGQTLKNAMLDEIADGWVFILDDDTLVHKDFLAVVTDTIAKQPELSAVVVSQLRTDGRVLRAASGNAVLGSIDAGQVVLSSDLIAGRLIPETYAGDGVWLESILRGRQDVAYLKSVLSLHNVLSGVDVSEPPERMSA